MADWPWCHLTDPPMHCGHCKHQPPGQQCPIAAPECELPTPQCSSFVDRGGTLRLRDAACDCYLDLVWIPCEEPPHPEGKCFYFPQGVPDTDFVGGNVLTSLGGKVNGAIQKVTGCAPGSNCVVNATAEQFYSRVNAELRAQGLWAGRHVDSPPGATDEIAVATSCTGWWEGYHIFNFGGNKVVWAPSSARTAWKIKPEWCPTDCEGTTPEPPEPPPTQECTEPYPDMGSMKFQYAEKGSHLDTTLVTVNQPGFCASIGYCCMPGTGGNVCGAPGCVPRGGCPVRPDGSPLRPVCETELCNQKWECNGAPSTGWKGNSAQTNCKGHYKTWCENAKDVVLEGDR